VNRNKTGQRLRQEAKLQIHCLHIQAQRQSALAKHSHELTRDIQNIYLQIQARVPSDIR